MKLIKHIYILLAIILPILGLLFYWYEYRPSKIRSFCAGFSNRVVTEYDKLRTEYNKSDMGLEAGQRMLNNEYTDCLRRCGLEK